MTQKITDYQLWEKSELAAVAGGGYFNPAVDLMTSGREIIVPELVYSAPMNFTPDGEATHFVTELFQILTSYLHPDESLFGFYRRGNHLLVPFLPHAISLATYEAQVQSGDLTRSGYYAVPNEIADRGLAQPFP